MRGFSRVALLSFAAGCGGAGCGGTTPVATTDAEPFFLDESEGTEAENAVDEVESSAEIGAEPAAPSEEVAALVRAFEARLTVSTSRSGVRLLSRHCRDAPVDCRERLEAFARLIVETAHAHDVDPLLIAAMALRESGLDPAALGRNREAGIVQLHPRGAGRGVRYVEDAAYRRRCQNEIDACQREVLERGVSTLARGIEECGSLTGGLGAYASGHCTERIAYPQRVYDERDRLRELVH